MSASSLAVYDKANSIMKLRAKSSTQKRVLERVTALRERLIQQQATGNRRSEIVRIACDDLLGINENPKFWLRDHVIEEVDRLRDSDLERYLYYRYRYDVYPAERIADDYPPCVQIEPASICNFRCVFCYQTDRTFSDKKSGHMGVMDLELFKRIIDQLEGEVEAISLASRGEPLVSPGFPEMLNYLSGKFLAVKVNTNASLLDERKSHEILESNIQTLVFSADAAKEPLYSQLRVNGSFERTLRNVERFMNIKETHYPGSRMITRVSGVAYSDEQDIDEMKHFWGQLVDQVIFVRYNPWENVYESPPNDVVQPCSDVWRRLFVWWDGRVNPCDVDYKSTMSPGTIEDRAISELWRGNVFEGLRQQHLAGRRQKLDPCARCFFI